MNSKNLLPVSIIIASILIGGSIILTSGEKSSTDKGISSINDITADIPLSNITVEDNYLGNFNNPIKIVEFSDYNCPFCARFHETVHQLVDNYSEDVVWVYKHFPVLGQDSRQKAVIAQCLRENSLDDFWAFSNKIFDDLLFEEKDTIQGYIDMFGVNQECLVGNDTINEMINNHHREATTAGGEGTPFSVIVFDGPINEDIQNHILSFYQEFELDRKLIKVDMERNHISISGAMPYELIANILDIYISSK